MNSKHFYGTYLGIVSLSISKLSNKIMKKKYNIVVIISCNILILLNVNINI